MTWVQDASIRNTVYSQIGLRVVDDFTGGPPGLAFSVRLERSDGVGGFVPVESQPTRTPSGLISFPALGRVANAGAAPMVVHRVFVTSPFYRPEYLRTVDALEFDVHPTDRDNPPAVLNPLPTDVFLLPSVTYPFRSHVRTVYGLTLDVGGDPIANVEVTESNNERVLSDERGAFRLPLRWPALQGPVTLDATDHRTGRSGVLNLTLPADLQQGHTFTLT